MANKASSTTVSQSKTPAQLGYKMPAEWAPHSATWLSWPHNPITWPGKHMAAVWDIYLQMLEGLLPNEKVNLLVNDGKEKEAVMKFLKPKLELRNLIVHEVQTVDAWIRDYGPTFIKKKTIDHRPQTAENAKKDTMDRGLSTVDKAYVKWTFNAWGEKYEDLMLDTNVFKRKELVAHTCFEVDIVLEGGSIEVNGEGTCLTTEQCLLNANRNPKLSREEIEGYLKNYLGVSNVVWLHEGIVGDDTDGHIDDIVRFVNPNTIVFAFEDNSSDANHDILKENWERLKQSHDEKGKKWNLVKLPMPGPVADGDVRLPASYANFLIANEVVLLPTYEHRNDKKAAAILKDLFPAREIISIPCTDLVFGLGAIHCVSQQEPA
jgi:agmatine deiminase